MDVHFIHISQSVLAPSPNAADYTGHRMTCAFFTIFSNYVSKHMTLYWGCEKCHMLVSAQQ